MSSFLLLLSFRRSSTILWLPYNCWLSIDKRNVVTEQIKAKGPVLLMVTQDNTKSVLSHKVQNNCGAIMK